MAIRPVSIRRGLALAGAKPRRQYPEQALHRAVAHYLDLACPRGGEVWWTTFPLGSGGSARGGQLKGMGTRAGTPDLLLIWQGRPYWIELKAGKGRLSDEQRECHRDLYAAGSDCVAICWTAEQVETMLRMWQIPLRATLSIGRYNERTAAMLVIP